MSEMEPLPSSSRNRPAVRPIVTVDGTALPLVATTQLARVVVDNDLRLPGMFELTFVDKDGTMLTTAGITIGSQVSITGSGTDDGRHSVGTLIVGEVTAIEGVLEELSVHTIVRGYTAAHRLQRATRSRTFLNSTDSDIAAQLAGEAGLTVAGIVPTTTTFPYLAQVNQTDWDFLSWRAAEIGYETGVSGGTFYFRPSTTVGTPVGAAPEPVTFPDDLVAFRPRVTAGNLTPDVEVRVWDPLQAMAFSQPASTPTGGADAPETLGKLFTATGAGQAMGGVLGTVMGSLTSPSSLMSTAKATMNNPSAMLDGLASTVIGALDLGSLGPEPSTTARIVNDVPFATGQQITTAGPQLAGALGSGLGSTYAEAEGEAIGDPDIQPGVLLDVRGVQRQFAGGWLVSHARHVFDDRETGYRTTFFASGGQDRSMLGLTSFGQVRERPLIQGVVCGVVSNNLDPLGKARVKVALPWLSPSFETDWAPVTQFVAGQRAGALFLPEVGDEVMLAFEFGDPRRPYVLGGLINNLTTWKLTPPPVASAGSMGGGMGGMGGGMMGGGAMLAGAVAGAVEGGMGASVQSPGMVGEIIQRGFVSSTGNCLLFSDQPLPVADAVMGAITSQPGMKETAGAVSGAVSGALGSSGGNSTVAVGSGAAVGALASSVTVGTQNGAVALTMDQVNAALSLTCNPVAGVSHSPVPQMVIASQDGMIKISAGPAGMVEIDGGTMLTLRATAEMNILAPVININGVPLP